MSANPEPSEATALKQIGSVVVFTAISLLSLGIPLAVLPGYLHDQLDCGAVITGLVLSAQALTTLAARPLAGRVGDRIGAKRAVEIGLICCGVSGLLTLVATSLSARPAASIAALTVARLFLGMGQGMMNTGALSWGISAAGPRQASRVISYNGIAGYGAFAIGPPLGAALSATTGLWVLGASVLALNIAGLWWVRRLSGPPVIAGVPLAFLQVLSRIGSLGFALALSSVGLSVISTFVTLYFASRGWAHAAFCLTAFGGAYIGARLLFGGGIIDKLGGLTVAIACFIVQIAGLLLLWVAPSPTSAIAGAALTGFGMSLIYPSLGVEVVRRVPAANRTSALGAFSLCLDLSLGISGPLAGLVAARFGFASIYLFAALMAAAGLAVVLRLRKAVRPPRAPVQSA